MSSIRRPVRREGVAILNEYGVDEAAIDVDVSEQAAKHIAIRLVLFQDDSLPLYELAVSLCCLLPETLNAVDWMVSLWSVDAEISHAVAVFEHDCVPVGHEGD